MISASEQFKDHLDSSSIIYNKLATSLLMRFGTDAQKAILSIATARGIAGFVFQCPQEENVELTSDITDYYVEDNTAIQDHIAHHPEVVVLRGLQGEYFYSNSLASRMVERVASKLPLVRELMPKIQLAKGLINKYGRLVKPVATLISGAISGFRLNKALGGSGRDYMDFARDYLVQNGADLFKEFQSTWKLGSNQTQAYLYFENLWRNGIVFSVDTSWKRFDNMVISKIQVKRDNNADITDFTITCKKVNFVGSIAVDLSQEAVGRAADQLSNVASGGKDSGRDTDLSKYLEVIEGDF